MGKKKDKKKTQEKHKLKKTKKKDRKSETVHCTGCKHHCPISALRCSKGRKLIQRA